MVIGWPKSWNFNPSAHVAYHLPSNVSTEPLIGCQMDIYGNFTNLKLLLRILKKILIFQTVKWFCNLLYVFLYNYNN